jgi:hypothetical protein
MSRSNLNDFTTIVISQASTSGVVNDFNLNSTIQNRILYVKEASISPACNAFTLYGYINNISSCSPSYGAAMTLHLSTNIWHTLGGFYTFDGGSVVQFSTQQLPVNSTAIYPSMKDSRYFVDLRTESKTVVLPPIQTIPGIQDNISPVYTFKDVFGNASNSSLFISSSGNALLENTDIENATRLNSNYASIDLFANLSTNRWHFLNYYGGNAVSEQTFTNVGIPSTTYISTSLNYVSGAPREEAVVNKITMLPQAETAIDQTFYIVNIGNNSSVYSLLSTQVGDFIDDRFSSIFLSTQWEAVQLVSHSSTRYSIVGDWKAGTAFFE